MLKRVAVVVTLLGLVAGLTVATSPGSSAVADREATIAVDTAARGPVLGERCRNAGKHVYRLIGVKDQVKVAYARSVVLEPGGVKRVIRNVRKDMDLRATINTSAGGELGAKGLSKLLAKAEIRFSAEFVGFAKVYTSRTTTVKQRIKNTASTNKEFIAFKATREYGGKYKDFFCTKHPVMRHPEWVLYSNGTWRTHKALESGTIRCGAGTPTEITAVVSNRHCG
ncbi:hypothetical protein DJ010_02540 [Nocardioides silvaticus]|uniref:Uncharacterized protein n=1 Tax=Nocardioides silvaticus TaxID=2201891 RepID=A0A316TL67_9ACTN|nr:hypothetical protein [Nocardioides silvaticus]PWN04528.1 hypothetical protein DJ010_02540 [Nocardioides silvaticus]